MQTGRHASIVVCLAAAVAVATPTACAGDRSFLWRVASGERTVSILGSIHFMKKDAYPLSPAIERAFDRSGVVVFETDLDDVDKAALQMLAAGTLDGDATLEDVVSAQTYRAVCDRLEALEMDIGAFRTMKPWMAALGLTSFELARAGYVGGEGVDAHFNARAKRAGKERRGLESIEFQVSLFADLTPEESEDFLRYTLQDLKSVVPVINEIVDTWKAGDTERVEALLAEGFDTHPALFTKLITDRNLSWLPVIEDLLEGDADAMVVVGSLHVVGEKGLVELLRARGHRVEQR